MGSDPISLGQTPFLSMIETIKRWHKMAPAPIIWLAATALLFTWLILVSAVFSVLNGGFDELASHLPQYAYQVGLKLTRVYMIALAAYLLFQLVARIRRD